MTLVRLYARVAVVGCWSLVVGVVGVVLASGLLSSLPGEAEATPGVRTAGFSLLALFGPLVGGLFEAGLSGMGAGAVLMVGGAYFCRSAGRSARGGRSTRL